MIKRAKLENWRSHKNTELEFDSGTNVLVGTMGSGKSSVMNAICFALFGTFPELQRRETKLEEVIMEKPSRMDSARVEIEFDYKGKNYKIERTLYRGQKTNTAKLYEEHDFKAGPRVSDVNERVEQLLELNYDLFSRAVYSEQNQMDFFIRLNPGERKQKFDELLELDKYEKVRRNAVSVSNTLKKILEEKRKALEEQKASLGLEELEGIRSEIKEINQKIREKRREKEKTEREVKELGKLVEGSRDKRKKFRELKEKSIALKQSIETLEREIHRIEGETKAKLEEVEAKKIERMQNELGLKAKKLKELEKELNQLNAEIQGLKAKIESLKEENRSISLRLPEKISHKKDLLKAIQGVLNKKEGLEKEKAMKQEKLVELEKKEKSLSEKIKINESREKEEHSILERIKAEKASCPLCKRTLTKESRQEIIDRTESILNELAVEKKKAQRKLSEATLERKALAKEISKIEEELDALVELKAFLGSLRNPLERMDENTEKIKKIEVSLKKLAKREKELRELEIEKELEKCELESKRIEKLLEGLNKKKHCEEKNAELEKVEQKIKELGFDEGKAIEMERELEKKTQSLKSFGTEIQGLIELVEEKKKREQDINAKKELIEKTEKKIAGLEFGITKLGVFVNALKATQAELRECLIETINEAMDTVWKRLYPYGDYLSAKMEIEKGNYELKVLTRTGKWRRIEGMLSGGERSAVALTLRIAFSLVLARNLGILILDEPTHNLDERAVSKLSEMMREHLSGLVDQVFLITHNKEMEKAANASLYLLERNKEEEGITRAELLSLRD